jgi:hypothetical protein
MFPRPVSWWRAVAAALVVLVLVTVPATAAERLTWSGEDATGDRYSFKDCGRGQWTATLMVKGETFSVELIEVSRCEEFIELRFTDRLQRLYKDKLLYRCKDGQWVDVAKGKWRD